MKCKQAIKQDLPVQEIFPEQTLKIRREISTFLLICNLKRFSWGVVSWLTPASPTHLTLKRLRLPCLCPGVPFLSWCLALIFKMASHLCELKINLGKGKSQFVPEGSFAWSNWLHYCLSAGATTKRGSPETISQDYWFWQQHLASWNCTSHSSKQPQQCNPHSLNPAVTIFHPSTKHQQWSCCCEKGTQKLKLTGIWSGVT